LSRRASSALSVTHLLTFSAIFSQGVMGNLHFMHDS
jgi:hypothetical protein